MSADQPARDGGEGDVEALTIALRDMEIERNALRITVRELLDSAAARECQAGAAAWDEGYAAAVSDSGDVVRAFERRNPYRAERLEAGG